MRISLAVLISLLTASAALAENVAVPGRQPQSLDDQLRRVQGGAPAATGSAYDRRAPAAGPREMPPAPAYDASVTPYSTGPAGDYVLPMDELVQKTENGIRYATGGVGEEEEAALKSMADQFTLEVLVTLADGAFLGDHSLRILDATGQNIFEAPGNGPYFYVALPPGTYTVEALRPNHTAMRQRVIVGKGLKRLNFRWPTE